MSERILVASAGPIIGALLGTGLIGFILWKVSDRVQRRRSELDRELEQQRADNLMENQLRHELLTLALTTAAKLYLETQHYQRVQDDKVSSDEDKVDARKALNAQYKNSRAAAMVLEARLKALFVTDTTAAVEWHKIDDLLTVRYMRLIGKGTKRLYEINARGYEGKEHTGLPKEHLEYDGDIIRSYHQAVAVLAEALMSSPIPLHRRVSNSKTAPP